MTGHCVNDMLVSVLPILYPIAKDRFGLSNADVGFITLAYTATGSLFQPFFGYLTDRWQRKWMAPLILAWSASWVGVYGFAGSFAMLILFAALAGLGSGAYHPLGASGAARVSDPRVRNTSLSLYTVGGTTGYAIGPLIAVLLFGWFGAKGTIALLIPGGLGVALLASQMGNVMRTGARRVVDLVMTQPIPYRSLSRIVGISMLRSWSSLALLQFLPVWYDDLGYSRRVYGPLATTMILAGVAGTLGGGAIADRIGGQKIIVWSQLLCVPALLLFIQFPGAPAFAFGALFGLASDSSLSVTLLAAQRLLPGRTGIASGIILGLGFITGGIGVPITGAIADHIGIDHSLRLLSLLCLGAALLALSSGGALFAAPREAESHAGREDALTGEPA